MVGHVSQWPLTQAATGGSVLFFIPFVIKLSSIISQGLHLHDFTISCRPQIYTSQLGLRPIYLIDLYIRLVNEA